MSRHENAGFTLVEMVVAFAILGISLTALFGVFETSLARTRHDTRLSEATQLSQSLLARVGTDIPMDEVVHSGKWQEFTYDVSSRPEKAATGQLSYTVPTATVTATVTWREAAGERKIDLSTIKLLPRLNP